MTQKQGDMIVLHNDNINNIHYKLGYIDSYTVVLFIRGDILVVEYNKKNITNDETMNVLKSWIVNILFDFPLWQFMDQKCELNFVIVTSINNGEFTICKREMFSEQC